MCHIIPTDKMKAKTGRFCELCVWNAWTKLFLYRGLNCLSADGNYYHLAEKMLMVIDSVPAGIAMTAVF